MRRLVLAALAVTLVGLSAVAFAASQKGRADFVPLAASGISGNVKLNGQEGKAETHVVLHAKNLQDVEYVVVAYTNNNCQTEATPLELARFTPKNKGMVNWSGKISRNIDQLGSISLQLASDQSVQACAAVVLE